MIDERGLEAAGTQESTGERERARRHGKVGRGQEKQQRRVSPPGALDLCEWPYLIIGVFKFPVAAAETEADV